MTAIFNIAVICFMDLRYYFLSLISLLSPVFAYGASGIGLMNCSFAYLKPSCTWLLQKYLELSITGQNTMMLGPGIKLQ